MKTSHQLARELLAGPDLPIFVYNKRDPDGEGEPYGHEPKINLLEGYDGDKEPVECLEIFGDISMFQPHRDICRVCDGGTANECQCTRNDESLSAGDAHRSAMETAGF